MAARLARSLLEPLPLVLLAAAAGLVVPSERLAGRSDAVLAALVLAVALTIDPGRLRRALAPARGVVIASLLPFATLLPLSVAFGRLFDGPERDGLLALGLAPTEVAAAGLVALAGGSAAFALAVVTVSLAATAVIVPLLAPLLSGESLDALDLDGRFSLVVLVPLALGLALRAGGRGARIEPLAGRAATVVLAVLVYAALGDLGSLSALGPAALAAALFLAASALLAVGLRGLLGDARSGPFVFSLRDFAVAAALAGQLGPPGAAATAAVYGVIMLVAAAAAATALRPRAVAGEE